VCGFTSIWKLALVLTMLVGFAGIGIGCVIKPDWASNTSDSHFAEAANY